MLPLSSVAAFHASETLFEVTAVERRLPGAVGGWVSLLGGVVNATTLLCCEALPAASNAPTEMSYAVLAVNVSTVALRVFASTTLRMLPPRLISYRVTATLSLAAAQVNVAALDLMLLTTRLLGGDGGVTSSLTGFTVSLSAFGPPSAVVARARILFVPAVSWRRTVLVCQVVQAPVPG